MREITFRIFDERPGHLEARAENIPFTIAAPTLEELHHEAREALIRHLGPVHVAFRTRIDRRRSPGSGASGPSLLSISTPPIPAPLL